MTQLPSASRSRAYLSRWASRSTVHELDAAARGPRKRGSRHQTHGSHPERCAFLSMTLDRIRSWCVDDHSMPATTHRRRAPDLLKEHGCGGSTQSGRGSGEDPSERSEPILDVVVNRRQGRPEAAITDRRAVLALRSPDEVRRKQAQRIEP